MTLAHRLADAIDQLSPGARVVVAVDGPDAAGKTTLADSVAQQLARPALRVSIDDWHNPRAVRLRRGDESPVGYYRDSFDDEALRRQLLGPFRSGASTVRTAAFDFRTDAPAVIESDVASPAAALVVDGLFLLRPELRGHWDVSIYLHVPESVTLDRALVRDRELLGGTAEVRRRYERRYFPGQALYREEASPSETADIVIDNGDPLQPYVARWFGVG